MLLWMWVSGFMMFKSSSWGEAFRDSTQMLKVTCFFLLPIPTEETWIPEPIMYTITSFPLYLVPLFKPTIDPLWGAMVRMQWSEHHPTWVCITPKGTMILGSSPCLVNIKSTRARCWRRVWSISANSFRFKIDEIYKSLVNMLSEILAISIGKVLSLLNDGSFTYVRSSLVHEVKHSEIQHKCWRWHVSSSYLQTDK
jgi:hypothetical protein